MHTYTEKEIALQQLAALGGVIEPEDSKGMKSLGVSQALLVAYREVKAVYVDGSVLLLDGRRLTAKEFKASRGMA